MQLKHKNTMKDKNKSNEEEYKKAEDILTQPDRYPLYSKAHGITKPFWGNPLELAAKEHTYELEILNEENARRAEARKDDRF